MKVYNTFDYTESSKFKLSLALVCSLFSVLVLIIFQPFGINNYQHELTITIQWIFIVCSFGLVCFITILLNEFIIRPFVFKNLSKTGLIVWFIWEFSFVGLCNFLYYNYLGGFHDLSISSLLLFVFNSSLVLLVPLIGTLFYFRYHILKKDYFDILEFSNDTNKLNDIVLISGDYKKDKIALSPANILFIRSQDNYVALNFLEGDKIRKHLIRFTLSNMEKSLNHEFLIRCNRSLIVNLNKVELFKRKSSKLFLKLFNYDEEILVSKKYKPLVENYLINHLKNIQ
jgi:hypothetical protein